MAKNSGKPVSENLLLGIIVILLVAVGFLTYRLYNVTLNETRNMAQEQENSILATTIPLPDSDLSQTSDGTIYKNKELGYSVIIPNGWDGREYRSIAGTAVQPYIDVIFLSPDYQQSASSVTDASIDEGASIFIRGTDTIYKTIEERYANNIVAKKVATNVKRTTVAGVPAIQYEYELTGENVTNVTFLKDGIWYLIKFQYADSKAQVRYQNVFNEVVSSFTLK